MSEQRLREAFERLNPSDEARSRMLENILAANAAAKDAAFASIHEASQDVVQVPTVAGEIPGAALAAASSVARTSVSVQATASVPTTDANYAPTQGAAQAQVVALNPDQAFAQEHSPKTAQSSRPKKKFSMIQYALPIAACLVFAAIAPTAIPQLVGLANSNIVEVGSDGDTSLIDDTTDADSDTTNNSVTEEGPSSGEPTEADPDETTWLPPFSLGPQAGAPEGSSVDEGDDPTGQSPNAQQDPSDAQPPSDATQNEDPDVVENAPGDSSSSSEPPTATIEPRPTQSVAIDDVALATDAQGAPSTPWIIAICISAAAILAAAIIAIFGIRSWRRSNGG